MPAPSAKNGRAALSSSSRSLTKTANLLDVRRVFTARAVKREGAEANG
jgi:hypothetical protein